MKDLLDITIIVIISPETLKRSPNQKILTDLTHNNETINKFWKQK